MKLNRRLIIFVITIALINGWVSCIKENAPGLGWVGIELLADNLEVPWGMEYLPNGDLLFCERSGKINLIKANTTGYEVIHERPVLNLKEGGLLGLAIDPNFNQTNYLFVYETKSSFNQIARLIYNDNEVTEDKVILDSIPSALFHNGGGLRFGPDGYLYAGTGDATDTATAQDKFSLGGKILRMDKSGNPAPNNPFGNHVWTFGHRNVQGFDWNENGIMIATEHGPSGVVNKWCCHDELNKIEVGNNYGWPRALAGTVEHDNPIYTRPLAHSGDDTWAPSGGSFINGSQWAHWDGDFVLAGLKAEGLIRFEFDASYNITLSKIDTLTGDYYRLRNIIQAPDGSIIFCTANVDGKNRPHNKGDDKLFRMFVR